MRSETTNVGRFTLKSRTLSLGAFPILAAGLLFACGIDSRPPTSELPAGAGGSGPNPSDGGMGGEGEPGGGNSGTGATSGGGTGGSENMSVCGDLFLTPDEECEDGHFRDETCESFGFSEGTLTCNKSCKISTNDCSGVEDCFDGKDNDGDGLVDCLDADDCSDTCEDACGAPPAFYDGMSVSGTTVGRGNLFDSQCSETPSGAEIIYEVTAGKDGRLDVILQTTSDLTLSVTTECGQPATEVTCSAPKFLSIDANEGEVFYVTIDGLSSSEEGPFSLEARSRIPGCGDGVRDVNIDGQDDEECDDFNVKDGDGCDENCFLEELDEFDEPNDTTGSAGALTDGAAVGWMASPADFDVYTVTLSGPSSSIVADTVHLGDGACVYNLMDTVIDVFDTDANGNALLTSDDNSGDGLCSRAMVSGLPAGTYYVQVSTKLSAEPSSFPYRLEVEVGSCGDGFQTAGEECDDENNMNDDGCSQDCELE